MRNINLLIAAAFVTVSVALVSCSKWDDFKKYTAAGETVYSGKMDSVKIYPGNQRVKLVGLLAADPKITKCKITWNDGADSVVYAITKGVGIDSFIRIFNVPEGEHNFTILTYDAVGNKSVKVFAQGKAYGPKYESGLVNRVASAVLNANNQIVITWNVLDVSSGGLGTWIHYTKTTGIADSVYVPASESSTTLNDFKDQTALKMRTLYRPTTTCIDTLQSKLESVPYDVTSLYLSNMGPGFQKATISGRWGTLAAPWITNAAAKNKGGVNGGFSSDAGGVICWETYGNTPVTNGIVYQPTATALPAGKYIVSFDEFSEIQTNSTVYCVAAAGATGIPVLADLGTTLGYTGLYNGATVGSNKPNLTDTRSFSFTLTSPTIVSIGFLGNLGTNNYFQVKRVQLFRSI